MLAPQEQTPELMIEPSSIVQGEASHKLEDDVHNSPVDSSHSEVPHTQEASFALDPSTVVHSGPRAQRLLDL